ncbi:hypothetical protein [Cellulomonas marina]|uniref:hypothetical protein n=1 Tax=Cellulomonas marina TaxID=988821 RepID=UPI001EF33CB6|nr:hypothetical protein [Cellulomonas marina]
MKLSVTGPDAVVWAAEGAAASFPPLPQADRASATPAVSAAVRTIYRFIAMSLLARMYA